MADVAELGIRIDSTGAIKAVSDLEKLTGVAAKADVATEKLATTSTAAAKGFGAGGQGARQMALQLSQVAQQGSVTGNYLGALAVQLPDMATGFGAVGIAAGVVASVALPLLVQWLGNTSSKMDAVQTQMDSLSDASKSYAAAVKAATIPTQELTDKYGALSEAARGALTAMADVARVDAIQATADAVAALGDALLQTERVNARQIGGTRALADDFGMAADAANRFEAALVALENAGNLRDQAIAAEQARNALIAAYGSVEKMPPTLQQAYKQLAGITVEAANINGTLSKTPGIINGITSAAQGLAGALEGVKGQAQSVLDFMARAYEEAQRLSQFTPQQRLDQKNKEYGGRGGDPRDFMNPQANTFGGNTYTPSATGGGGGGADEFQSRLDALQQSLMTETEMVNQWYADAQAVLADRRAQELMGTQAHKDALLAIEKSYNDQIAAIEMKRQQTQLTDAAGFFGAMASVAAAGGGKMVKAVAIFSAAQGLINSYAAYTAMLADPAFVGRPWARFAAAASVLASGLQMVAAIRGAGGIGGGSGGAKGKVAAQGGGGGGTQQPIEYIVRGIDKAGMYSGEMLSQIFDGLSAEAGKRGMPTFTFI